MDSPFGEGVHHRRITSPWLHATTVPPDERSNDKAACGPPLGKRLHSSRGIRHASARPHRLDTSNRRARQHAVHRHPFEHGCQGLRLYPSLLESGRSPVVLRPRLSVPCLRMANQIDEAVGRRPPAARIPVVHVRQHRPGLLHGETHRSSSTSAPRTNAPPVGYISQYRTVFARSWRSVYCTVTSSGPNSHRNPVSSKTSRDAFSSSFSSSSAFPFGNVQSS